MISHTPFLLLIGVEKAEVMSKQLDKKWYAERWHFLRETIIVDDGFIFVFTHPQYQWVEGKSYELFLRTEANNFSYHDSFSSEEEAKSAMEKK